MLVIQSIFVKVVSSALLPAAQAFDNIVSVHLKSSPFAVPGPANFVKDQADSEESQSGFEL